MNSKALTIMLSFLFFLDITLQASAGNLELSDVIGSVTNENGVALVGATIFIKELNKTGITNDNGEFVLHGIRNGKYRVEIFFVGYEPYRTEIDIKEHIFRLTAELKLSTRILDDVQIIAYGTTTQRLNTGYVTTGKDA